MAYPGPGGARAPPKVVWRGRPSQEEEGRPRQTTPKAEEIMQQVATQIPKLTSTANVTNHYLGTKTLCQDL